MLADLEVRGAREVRSLTSRDGGGLGVGGRGEGVLGVGEVVLVVVVRERRGADGRRLLTRLAGAAAVDAVALVVGADVGVDAVGLALEARVLDAGGLGGGAVLLGLLLEAAGLGGLALGLGGLALGLGGLALGLGRLAVGLGAGVGRHRGGHRRAVLGALHLRQSLLDPGPQVARLEAARLGLAAARRRDEQPDDHGDDDDRHHDPQHRLACVGHAIPLTDYGSSRPRPPKPTALEPRQPSPSFFAVASRISTLRTLPVTVIGNSSTIST